MLNQNHSYFSIKYYFLYSWLIAIVVYFSRSLFGYGSTITVAAQFWADTVAIICIMGYIVDGQLVNKHLKRIFACIFLIVFISIIYYLSFEKYAAMTEEMIGETASSFDRLKLLVYTLLAFVSASFFTKKKILTDSIMVVFFYVLWVLSIILYYQNDTIISEIYGSNIVVNNFGYLILSILPISLLVPKPIRMVYLITCIYFGFMSAKRGAALESVLMFLVVSYISVKNINRWYKYLLLIVTVVVLYYIFMNNMEDIAPIIMRLERDGMDSESRSATIQAIITGIMSGNMLEFIMGYGPLGSVIFAGNFAHNDFLEFMCDYGIIGFGILFLFYWFSFKSYLFERRKNVENANIILVAICVCLLKSFFSMNLFDSCGPIHLIALGYSLSRINEIVVIK